MITAATPMHDTYDPAPTPSPIARGRSACSPCVIAATCCVCVQPQQGSRSIPTLQSHAGNWRLSARTLSASSYAHACVKKSGPPFPKARSVAPATSLGRFIHLLMFATAGAKNVSAVIVSAQKRII